MKNLENVSVTDRAGAVALATTAELVEWYNAHAESPVKKFADRKTAERRVLALLEQGVKKTVQRQKAERKAPQSTGEVDRSAIVAETWLNPNVAAARAARDHVLVDGVWFVSVRQAFIDLGLPLNEHAKFRLQLKRARKLEGYNRKWVITNQEAAR